MPRPAQTGQTGLEGDCGDVPVNMVLLLLFSEGALAHEGESPPPGVVDGGG